MKKYQIVSHGILLILQSCIICRANTERSNYKNCEIHNVSQSQSVLPLPQNFHGTVNNTGVFSWCFDIEIDPGKNNRISANVYNNTGKAVIDTPVSFFVSHGDNSFTWTLPVTSILDGTIFWNASRLLCIQNTNLNTSTTTRVLLVVSTTSKNNLAYNFTISSENIARIGTSLSVSVEPNSPAVLVPTFSATPYLIEFSSTDALCATVSVQKAQCPYMDQEENVIYNGYWQTMTTTAGIVLWNGAFKGNEIRIVVVLHGKNWTCLQNDTLTKSRNLYFAENDYFTGNTESKKNITITVHSNKSIQNVLFALFIPLAILVLVYTIAIVTTWKVSKNRLKTIKNTKPPQEWTNGMENPEREYLLHHDQTGSVESVPSASENKSVNQLTSSNTNADQIANSSTFLHESIRDMSQGENSESSNVHQTTVAQPANRHSLTLRDVCTRKPESHERRSKRVFLVLLCCFAYYFIPVFQMVRKYELALLTTGNMDQCFFNYLCSYPLLGFVDFNHIYSNIGYILLGVLFNVLVFMRSHYHTKLVELDGRYAKELGVPNQFGHCYAMGSALIMEGFLSACYHICPNEFNFQYDTMFMYVIAALCIIKIYKTRHPESNPSSYEIFIILSVIAAFVPGIKWFDDLKKRRIFVFVAHIVFGGAMYYFHVLRGQSKLCRDSSNPNSEDDQQSTFCKGLLCQFKKGVKKTQAFSSVLLVVNLILAMIELLRMPSDFASFLLLVFIINLGLHFLFYCWQKFRYEHIQWKVCIFLCIALLFGGASGYFFLRTETSWQDTPAGSRSDNEHCLLLSFYDSHDIWHFLSSFGIFFAFIALLTLDDDLMHTKKGEITVFEINFS